MMKFERQKQRFSSNMQFKFEIPPLPIHSFVFKTFNIGCSMKYTG